MAETLYRKSWQPLAEADKSESQVVRHAETGEVLSSLYRSEAGGWCTPDHDWMIFPENVGLFEFLCLEPVEVETDKDPWPESAGWID